MKTIEERAAHLAEEFGATKANKESAIYRACIRMATEQKAIDEAELGKELLYVAHKTTERVRKEVIDKACEWLKKHCGMNDSGLVQFRKAMEEE